MRKLTSKNAGTMHSKILRATSMMIVSGAFVLFCICFSWFSCSNVLKTSTNNAVNHFIKTASFLCSQTLCSSLDTLPLHEEYSEADYLKSMIALHALDFVEKPVEAWQLEERLMAAAEAKRMQPRPLQEGEYDLGKVLKCHGGVL